MRKAVNWSFAAGILWTLRRYTESSSSRINVGSPPKSSLKSIGTGRGAGFIAFANSFVAFGACQLDRQLTPRGIRQYARIHLAAV